MESIWAEDAEESVLVAIRWDSSVAEKAIIILEPDDFYLPSNRLIFKAIKQLFDDSQEINLVTITDSLRKTNELDTIGGIPAIEKLNKGTIDPAGIISFCNIVRNKSLKRQILRKNILLSKTIANKDDKDIEKILEEEINLARAIPGETSSIIQFKDILEKDWLDRGYETGFTILDKLLIKLHSTEYFIIAGRPSFGKSTFALNLATNFAKNNIPVLFFSFEMGLEDLRHKLIASESRINYNKIIYKNLDEFEEKKYNETIKRLKEIPLFFEEKLKNDISHIERVLRQFKINYPEFIVVIDYLQLISTSRGETREQEIADISRRIKLLTMELNIPIVVLSQLSRKVDARGKNAEPILSDLRESGAIEQDADIVLFLHRDNENIHSENTIETIKFLLQKRRNGATGKFQLTFHKNYTRFDNYIEETPYE